MVAPVDACPGVLSAEVTHQNPSRALVRQHTELLLLQEHLRHTCECVCVPMQL